MLCVNGQAANSKALKRDHQPHAREYRQANSTRALLMKVHMGHSNHSILLTKGDRCQRELVSASAVRPDVFLVGRPHDLGSGLLDDSGLHALA